MKVRRPVAVIGCGVIGLTTGISLLESGFAVRIFTEKETPHTTSDVAAAYWYPSTVNVAGRGESWGRESYARFSSLTGVNRSGVSPAPVLAKFKEPLTEIWWQNIPLGFRTLSVQELHTAPGTKWMSGYSFESFLFATPIYMPFLRERFAALGGTVLTQRCGSLSEIPEEFSLIANCAGVGSRELVPDKETFAIRGQVIQIERPQNFPTQIHRTPGATIVPRPTDCILGGTFDIGNYSLEPDEETARGILERCRELYPALGEVKILRYLVGLRPGRSSVRLEPETLPDGRTVIHNYGHGGAGFSLSWGCAAEVVSIAEKLAA